MALVPQVAVVSGLRNSIMNIDTQADLANYLRADVINCKLQCRDILLAMECLCKVCGKTLGKDRRPFSGRPYSALFEMVRDHKAATGQALSATEIHCVLASTPSYNYVCKQCNSALSKYESIMKQVDVIKTFMKSVFNIEPADHTSLPVS